jgi:hypothetical protein
MGTNELSMQLWRERELLEFLLFKLEEQELLLAAGRSRWIQFASREIEQVLDRLRLTAAERGIESAVVAEEWGAPTDASLRDLVERAPNSAWHEVFSDHLRVLTQLVAEIQQMRDASTQQLRAIMLATQETIAGLGHDGGQYTTRGETTRDDAARFVDTQA